MTFRCGRRSLVAGCLAAFLASTACSGPSSPGGEAVRSPAEPSVTSPAGPSPALSLSPTQTPTPAPAADAPLPPLEEAGQIGAELVKAETQIRSESTPTHLLARLGRIQQAAYRKLVENPDFRPGALAKAPGDLRPVLQSNIAAGEELRALTKPVTELPKWKIVTPPPQDELRRFYAEAEREFGIPWAYLASIHLVETRMGRIRGTSTAGAQGPMQFIPQTWAAYGRGDINSPRDSILAAARYLKASGAPSDMNRALFAYNHSQRYVRAITAYARQMLANERAYLGYYHWQVYVRTVNGDVLLQEGYGGA